MTPNARFTEFIKDINPSPTTNARSKASHAWLRNALWADEIYQDKLLRDFLGGSYKRQTAVRPVTKSGDTERPDVDIYVVVKGSIWTAEPEDLLNELFSALNRNRDEVGITSLKRNRCSIAVSTNQADMDVSPLLERQSDGLYRIGNRNSGEWYATDPEQHSTWSSDRNEHFSGRFKPLVKMLKWAQRENPTKYRHPKSFSLEAIVAQHMGPTETHYGHLIHDTFDSFLAEYEWNRTFGFCPSLSDPAVAGGNLLAGVSGEAFCAFYDKIESHRNDAAKALEADNQDKATKHWRRIFGDRFPASKSQSASSNLKNTATVSPLSFPSKAAQPSQKRAKFA